MPPLPDLSLDAARRIYARQILAAAGALGDRRLEAAFATVPREDFVTDGAWRIFTVDGGLHEVPADPVLLLQNVLVSLDPARSVNNGSPVLHARWMHAVPVRPGERVAHIGAGTGYFTAILAELVGAEGRVIAVEVDAALAAVAREALPGVDLVVGDGAEAPAEEVDVVYVNFSAARPAAPWLDRLADGGRLIFPLGVPAGPAGGARGAALLVTRRGDVFDARVLGPAYFVAAEGSLAGAPEAARLRAAFEAGGVERVRRLRWREPPDEGSWFVGDGWSLSAG